MGGLRMLLALLVMTFPIAPVGASVEADAALRACRAETEDSRRLACYDREMDRMAREPESAGVAAPAEAPAAPPVLTAEDRFGREGEMTRAETDRKKEESLELGELKAKVAEIRTRGDGLMVVTLDNGQVWKQNSPDSFFRLKAGDEVKIQPAALGSFLMSGPSKRSTRVTRLK